MDKAQNPKGLQMFAIFSIFFIAMGVGTVTPAIAMIIGHWAPLGVSVSNILLVSTLPTLTMVPVVIISGALAGKKVSFKTLAILGCACFAIFGSMPAIFTNSWGFVLFCRAMFGVGLGLISPLGNALILGLYDADKRATFLGYGSLMSNIGGIVLQLMGGALSPTPDAWNLCFWAHALGFLSMILCFFLPEIPKAEVAPGAKAEKRAIPGFVWVASIVLLLFNLVNYPLLMNSSTWVQLNVTDQSQVSFIAAVATSFFTVGGMISSALFGKFFGKLGKTTLAIGCFSAALGAIIMRFCGSAWVMIVIGFFLDGFGFCLVLPGIFAYVGMTTKLADQAFAISIITAIMSVAGFICTYYLMFIVNPIFGGAAGAIDNASYYGETIAAAVVFVLIGIFWFVFNPLKGAPAPAPENK